jgi:phosphate-selective porin OprO/OprP
MKKRWSTLVAAGAGTAAIGLTGPALALTDSQRFEKLEQHIQQLERRLEQTEAENQKLKKHSGAKEPAYASPEGQVTGTKI